MNATVHRRKATTYGKASHKPIVSTREAFTKIVEVDAWDFENDVLDWRKDAVPALANTVSTRNGHIGAESLRMNKNPSAFYGSPNGKSDRRGSRDRSSSPVASRSVEKTESLDETSLGHNGQQRSRVSFLDARKRRRIGSEAADKDCSFVYDDVSLQEHIAAESWIDLSRTYLRPHGARSDNSPLLQISRNDPESDNHKDGCELSQTQKDGNKGAAGRKMTNWIKTPTMAEVRPCSQSHISDPKIPPHELRRTVTNGSNAINGSKLPGWMPSKGSAGSLPMECDPPVTPSKPIKYVEGSTTPRQRELWRKLLFDDVHKADFSLLSLHGPKTADMGSSRNRETFKEPENVLGGTTKISPNIKRKRIVDTLHSYDHDMNCEHDCSGEDSEISTLSEKSDFAESEEPEASEVSTMNDTPITQTLSSTVSQHQLGLSSGGPLPGISQPISSIHTIGPKFTYAQQRSYLKNSDLDEFAIFSDPVATTRVRTNGSVHNAVIERLSNPHPPHTPDDRCRDNNNRQSGGLRSVHELREAGGNVRLICELEAILDDIEEEPSSSNLRRIRLLDLNAKFSDRSNSRLFIDQGLESRLLAHVDTSPDTMTNFLLATAILQLIANPASNHLLSQVSDARIVGFLVDLLGLDQDLTFQAKLREYNVSKHVRQEFRSFCSSIMKSAIWQVGSPSVLSCHMLALQCLEHIVRQTRESGSLSEVLPAHAIRRIVATSIPHPSTPSLHRSVDSAITLELAVSILEFCTISNAAECQGSLWEGETLERIVLLLPLSYSWEEANCRSLRTLTLRLYVNLTNNNSKLCEHFSTPEIAEVLCKMITVHFEQLSNYEILHQQPGLLDNLILSLGAFVNLAESSDTVRRLTMRLQLANRSFLAILLELFTTRSKSAAEVENYTTCVINEANFLSGVLRGRK